MKKLHMLLNLVVLKPMLRLLDSLVAVFSPFYEKWFDFKYHAGGYLRKKYLAARFKTCGAGLIVNGKPLIFNPKKISVGNHVTINNGVQIAPRGNVIIDDYVTFSRGSQITAGQLDTSKWQGGGYKKVPHVALDVHIGEGTWLCVNSIVLPGVNISGKGVIVAAGAVVTKDIKEDYVIVGGVPAQIIKRLGVCDE